MPANADDIIIIGADDSAMAPIRPVAISVSDAAKLLGISKPTMYQVIHQSDFPAFRLGGRTLISIDGLRDWVRARAKGGVSR